MAVRVFTDRTGQRWSVWRVKPTSSTAGLQERFQNGWLCFERAVAAKERKKTVGPQPQPEPRPNEARPG